MNNILCILRTQILYNKAIVKPPKRLRYANTSNNSRRHKFNIINFWLSCHDLSNVSFANTQIVNEVVNI
ncbi:MULTISPECIES: hypothetical protein [Campylobacter]|uniref:hypothetical protein n=1 Tax=Campylobacter TaxID=194 RepID=UPI000A35898F|nr:MULTISPECIES: hypothetical protein [unclassified Campylobacter]MCR8679833.1 hypothetical protein [Campylobacter sp. RM19072]MEE3777449.1 hypothetical protein [Campylobacter sp. CX2-4080-23]